MDYAETCYIITGICIVISIIFSALTKYIDNKNKKQHKEECGDPQKLDLKA